jgi:hypothetical protein
MQKLIAMIAAMIVCGQYDVVFLSHSVASLYRQEMQAAFGKTLWAKNLCLGASFYLWIK